MSKGAYGFIINNKEKIIYSRKDSHFDKLGIDVINFIKAHPLKKLKHVAKIIKNSDNTTTSVTIFQLYEHVIKNFKEIYVNLNNNFLNDSLFCEYAYIMNMDTELLEVYTGLNKDKFAPGRYASNQSYALEYPDNYCGVVLRREIPFNSIWENELHPKFFFENIL